jgi:hypothetical protein
LLCCSYLSEHGSECRAPLPSADASRELNGAIQGPAQTVTHFHMAMLHL